MTSLIRRFRQPALIAISILSVLSFVVLYNLPNRNAHGPQTQVAMIYGRPVTQAEVERTGRRLGLLQELGKFEMLMSLIGRVQTQNQAQEAFLWNTLILRHEAEALGIMSANPGKGEQEKLAPAVADRTQQVPAFQTNGAFDYGKYAKFVQEALAPRGFNASELDEVIADEIRLEKVKETLGSTVTATQDEIRDAFREQSQKTEVSVVRLKFDDFKASAQVTDEDVKKLYDERKDSLKTAEKRKVKFAAFTLAKQTTPLVGEARGQKLQELADRAQAFAEAMTQKEANFDETAKKMEAEVGETPAFEAANAPKELDANPNAAQAAFALTKEQPNSDVVSAENGSYVLQLGEIEPARQLTLEEAKPKLEEQIKEDKAREAMNLKATAIRTKMQEELKAGKPVVAAAEAAGAKAEKLAPYSMMEPLKSDADARDIMSTASQLAYDQLSEFVQTATGGVIVHLDRKLPVDEADFTKQKEMLTQNFDRRKREAIFQEWLKVRYKAANIAAFRG